MDTLSHALWGRGLFGYRGYKWLAIFFGAMPDLFSFGILIIVRIFSGNYTYSGPPSLENIPNWIFFNYIIQDIVSRKRAYRYSVSYTHITMPTILLV